MTSVTAKQNVVSALCKYLSLDSSEFPSDLGSDVRTLCSQILSSSRNGKAAQADSNELMKWIGFAENFLGNTSGQFKNLCELNEEMITKSVVLGNGLRPSAADIIVFSVVHSSVRDLSTDNKAKVPHLLRWVDYIQNKEDLGELFEKILLEKVLNVPSAFNFERKVEDSKGKKTVLETKGAINLSADSKPRNNVDALKKKVEGSNQAASEKNKLPEKEVEKKKQPEKEADKKKVPEKEVEKKDEDLSISLLKIQIGLIHKAWKHPSADSLLVEEIDVGEEKCRQVVSGLAKFCTPDQLMNRRVVLITNVKPGKLRDVTSQGLVLCASNQDHSIVEPLIAPDEAKIGECVVFSGHDGKPEDVLNPKKKQLEKITPHLFTDDKGVATFKGIPFTTSAGPCTSSIPNATIK